MKRFFVIFSVGMFVFLSASLSSAGELDTYQLRTHKVDEGVYFHHGIYRFGGHRTVVHALEHVLDNGTVLGRTRTIRFGSGLDYAPAVPYVGRSEADSAIIDAQIRWIGERLRNPENETTSAMGE